MERRQLGRSWAESVSYDARIRIRNEVVFVGRRNTDSAGPVKAQLHNEGGKGSETSQSRKDPAKQALYGVEAVDILALWMTIGSRSSSPSSEN